MRVHRLREEANSWGRKTDRYTTFLSLLSRVHSAVDWSYRKGCDLMLICIFIKD